MPVATYQSRKSGMRLDVLKVGFQHVTALEAIEAYSRTVPNEQISFHIELQRTSSKFIAASILPPGAGPADRPGASWKTALRGLQKVAVSIASRRAAGEIVAFAGMSFRTTHPEVIVITTTPEWRRRGIADVLMLQLLEMGKKDGAQRVALEVRKSNLTAQALYSKYLYKPQRVLPKHYTDNDEDAILMHTPLLDDRDYIEHLERLRGQLDWRPI